MYSSIEGGRRDWGRECLRLRKQLLPISVYRLSTYALILTHLFSSSHSIKRQYRSRNNNTKQNNQQEKEPTGPDSPVTYALPSHDENAPDLYIPTMSLLTYVLLCALCYGTAGKFNPEVLPDVTTKCLATQILEVVCIRIGFYLMEAPVAIFDLLSYTGYKYLGLSVNMLSGVALGHFVGYGHRAYYFTYLWTATAVSYFILKVMANTIPRITSAVGPKRQFMVLGFAGSQFATCWFVSQTKFLD